MRLLIFVGYHGALAPLRAIFRMPAAGWSRSPARWRCGRASCCSTNRRLGLMSADKDALGGLLRRIAVPGIAVILVEHDMRLVMGISDHIVCSTPASRSRRARPNEIRRDARFWPPISAAPRCGHGPAAGLGGPSDAVLTAIGLTAGYGAAPVVQKLDFQVRPAKMVALIGANGAGKSTIMRAAAGLLRPIEGD